MTPLFLAMLALLATSVHGDGGKSDYMWWAEQGEESAAQLPQPLWTSPDVCRAGNGGIRDVTFSACLKLCSLDPQCKVVSWYPSWFGDSPACFAYNNTTPTTRESATSSVPVSLSDQGVYVGVKKFVLGIGTWDKFRWSKGLGVGSPAQLPDPLFMSPDVCQAGNGGYRNLTLQGCLDVCVTIKQCKALAYYPVWFKGPSACFAYGSASKALKLSATSSTLTTLTYVDKGNYLGVKI